MVETLLEIAVQFRKCRIITGVGQGKKPEPYFSTGSILLRGKRLRNGFRRRWAVLQHDLLMQRRLIVQRLESREMLSSTAWIGGSGLWSQASNWSNGVPTASVAAIVNPSSPATITIQPGQADTAQSLTLGVDATLSLPGGGNPANPASNLITYNAGFESPSASNGTTRPSTWGSWGSAYLSTQYADGGSESVVASGNNSGVMQAFNVTPGASYTASVYAMMAAGYPLTGGIVAEMQVLFFDPSNKQISSYSPPNQIVLLTSSSATGGPLTGSVGSEGWNHFFTTVVAPSNAATARLQLATWSSGSYGGAAYFDSVQFGPAVTIGPSTLTLGSLVNNGAIVVGPTNSIDVNGGFTQSSSGAMDVQLGGAPSTGVYGSLTITAPRHWRERCKPSLPTATCPRPPIRSRPSLMRARQAGFPQ